MTENPPPPSVSAHPAVVKYARHVNAAFVKLLGMFGYGRLFVRAKDVWLWDHEGKKYLDLLANFGAANLGHNHPRLAERLRAHLGEEVPGVLHVGPAVHPADLAEALAVAAGAPLEVALFANGGAEAVEAALKLARAATGRSGFLSCAGGFHGTNLGALSILGSPRLRKPFEPLLAGCATVPFGDAGALERALAPGKTAAFVVEPIQAEGGVVVPPAGWLRRALELCRKHGTLFVLDEIQTGLGRTGTLFAFQAEGVVPDVLVIGKSLGGSLVPVSAALTSREIHERAYGATDRFDLHGSTFAGYALGCTAAMETLAVLRDERLSERARERGERLVAALRKRLAGHPLVREVRGRGLLVGIELGPTGEDWTQRLAPWVAELVSQKAFGQWASMRLLERGMVCQPASQQWNVLRLEPPLTIADTEIDAAVQAIGEVLDEYRGLTPVLVDVAERLAKQFLSGWKF